MSNDEEASQWLAKHGIEYVETITPDFAGVPRGKIQPASQLIGKNLKLPIGIFGQTITGDYYLPKTNIEDRDMILKPDLSTLRLVPWAVEPTACVMVDCEDMDGTPVETAPRAVLQRVVSLMAERGLTPVVAPEVEFYLQPIDPDATDGEAALLSNADPDEFPEPYGFDRLHDLGDLIRELSELCQQQDIQMGAWSQELGPGQFEVNFGHGDPVRLADDVFHFKRSLKRVAQGRGLRATFLAKLDADMPGSSMHIHQSAYDKDGENAFSTKDGEPSDTFHAYMGGLQRYMPEALLLFAPYPNSYRRFLSHWSSPVNLEWGVDNRTVGLRVPDSPPDQRRIENRLAGSDVNPYLTIAGTLACGYAGVVGDEKCRPAIEGSGYEAPFALHLDMSAAVSALKNSKAMRSALGDEFIDLYCAAKDMEFRAFGEMVPDWESKDLAQLV